ncbi:MAG TPA: hypothetical protein VG206_09125 [Terriglobia bacterium]|nr:hypothetical protein [Terriglobia bacterium]
MSFVPTDSRQGDDLVAGFHVSDAHPEILRLAGEFLGYLGSGAESAAIASRGVVVVLLDDSATISGVRLT